MIVESTYFENNQLRASPPLAGDAHPEQGAPFGAAVRDVIRIAGTGG